MPDEDGLDDLEEDAVEGVRTAVSSWAKKQKARPVVSNLVLYLGECVCEELYANVDGLDGKDDAELADHFDNEEWWLKGKKVAKEACFNLEALPHLHPSKNDFETIIRFAHRVCARLEADRDLGPGVDVAPTLVAVPIQHDAEDILSTKSRRLAREWLKQPAKKYLQSFGKS